MNYYIDKKVLAMLVQVLPDSADADKFFSDYSEKVQEVQNKVITEYLSAQGVAPDDIFEFIMDYGAVTFDPIEMDTKYESLKSKINWQELNELVQIKMDDYNKLVYLKFSKSLPADKINEINEYLKVRADELNKQVQEYADFLDSVISEVEIKLKKEM
jgi:hypothetical protein